MPKTELEIKFDKTVNVTEVVKVEVDVPQSILDDPFADFGLQDWVDAQLQIPGSEVAVETAKEENIEVEDETTSYEITEVNDFGPHD
jgi:hypothetical protein